MARTKIIPDTDVLHLVLQHLLSNGEKATSFAAIAAVCGLAAPTLVQRYGSRDLMVKLAIHDGWDRLNKATVTASDDAFVSAKGAQSMLKVIASSCDTPSLMLVSARDKELILRAELWRSATESALSDRLGGGTKGREAAGLMFAAWQGRLLWDAAGGKSFRLGEALRKLADHRAM